MSLRVCASIQANVTSKVHPAFSILFDCAWPVSSTTHFHSYTNDVLCFLVPTTSTHYLLALYQMGDTQTVQHCHYHLFVVQWQSLTSWPELNFANILHALLLLLHSHNRHASVCFSGETHAKKQRQMGIQYAEFAGHVGMKRRLEKHF